MKKSSHSRASHVAAYIPEASLTAGTTDPWKTCASQARTQLQDRLALPWTTLREVSGALRDYTKDHR